MASGQEAVTSTYAFVIAVGIMLTSVAAVYTATNDLAAPGTVEEVEQVNLQSEAAWLKDIIIGSPGIVNGGAPWDERTLSADDLVRLGLLEPDGSGLQIEKMRNLRLAPRVANDTDGWANYEEVRTQLGLDDKNLDFHIRAKPTLQSAAEIAVNSALRDQQLKVTYIGNVSSEYSGVAVDNGLSVTDFSCGPSPAGGPSYRYSINVTNGGQSDTQFFVVFDITNDGTTVTRQDQSGLVAKDGGWEVIHVDIENTDDVDCDADSTADVDILDPAQILRTESLSSPTVDATDPGSPTGSHPNGDGSFYITAGNPVYANATDETISISYYGDVANNDPLELEIREGTDPSGTLAHSVNTTANNGQGQAHIDIDPSDLNGAGVYTAYMTHPDDTGVTATQRFLLVAPGDEPGAFTPAGASGQASYEEDPAMAIEIGFLDKLTEQFCPTYYDDKTNSSIGADWDDRCSDFKEPLGENPVNLWDGQVQPGDVFPDLQKELWEMESRLTYSNGTPRYDITNTIVVGSNVAHNSMTSNNFGDPLEQWVLGGGTLIVFGSPGQSTQWLQNLFHAGQASSSGGISAPDISHPLISTPEYLDYAEYETSEKGWKYTGGADDHFTNVVEQGSTPVTAISDPGDFGEGTIVLTSWLPYDLFGTGDGSSSDEGLRLMQNFLMQSYRDLFLDYGPPLPDGAPAIPAVGRSYVDHEDLGQITIDFVLFVFAAQS